MKKRLGLIVNPVAGMGGRVGLKGTDGAEALRLAQERGATPESPERVAKTLSVIKPLRGEIDLFTYPGVMGEDIAREQGFCPIVLGEIATDGTSSEDTKQAAVALKAQGIELLLFGGGDGTARDILDAINGDVVVLGIPAGVKMHSAVFATDPIAGGEIAREFIQGNVTKTRQAEVMDIDEDAFRSGRLSAHLYGVLLVPHVSGLIQDLKSGSSLAEEDAIVGIAEEVIDRMDETSVYIFGPGTTTRTILDQLGFTSTLLGVDAVTKHQVLGHDLNETELLEIIKGRAAYIIVTPIGGQGYILGRGNQQISPKVIREAGLENLWVVASKAKLLALGRRPLRVDTGDSELDETLRGYRAVIIGPMQESVVRVM